MANINIRVPDEMAEKLKTIAKLNGVSLSDYVRGLLGEKGENALSRVNIKSGNDEIAKLRLQQKKMEDALCQLADVFAKEMKETQAWIQATLLLATSEENVISAYHKAKGGG